ncbi:MAG: autotransporter outer membrane beta-barrel domain-containing protein [Pseudomonadota bacterium]
MFAVRVYYWCTAILLLALLTGSSKSAWSDEAGHSAWTARYTFAYTREDTAAFPDFVPGTAESTSNSVEFENASRSGLIILLSATHMDYVVVDDVTPAGFSKPGELGWQSVEFQASVTADILGIQTKPSVVIGVADYHLSRPDPLVAATALADSKGWNIELHQSLSKLIPLTDWLFLNPTVALEFSYLTVDPFTERGAGAANVSFGRLDDHRFRLDSGAQIGAVFPAGSFGTVSVLAEALWQHNVLTGPYKAQASSALLGNLGNVALARGPEANGASLSGTITWNTPNFGELTAGYSGQFFKSTTTHTVGITAGFRF